jgi:lanosterol synthase
MANLALWTPLDVPLDGKQPFTDYSRWRLRVSDGGRHTWHYLRTDEETARWPQTPLDKYWLGLPTVSTRPRAYCTS